MGKRLIWSVLAALVAPAAALAARDPNGDGYGEIYGAWAQRATDGPPIDWWTLLYFFVACLGIAVVAFKGSRRTHLD